MNFRDRMLSEDGFESTSQGFKVTLRLPRYRSLPVSCIQPSLVKVDGEAVPLDGATLHLNDTAYPLDELASRYEDQWFVTDPAELHVRHARPLSEGRHDVEVELRLRIPYVFMENGREALVEVAGAKKQLTLTGGEA